MMIATFIGIVVAINLGRLEREKAEAEAVEGFQTIERGSF